MKAETHRALKEMEQGIEKYRATASAFEELREFDELAKQTGTTMKAAMQNYVGIEKMLEEGVPQATLDRVAPGVKTQDLNNLFGALEFAQKTVKEGIQPIIGCQMTLDAGEACGPVVLLVQDLNMLSAACAQVQADTDQALRRMSGNRASQAYGKPPLSPIPGPVRD